MRTVEDLRQNDDSYITGRREAFSIRANLSSGIYYIVVLGYKEVTGDYTLHADVVTDPEEHHQYGNPAES